MSVTEIAFSLHESLQAQLPQAGFRLLGIEVHVGARVDLDPEHLRAALVAVLPRVAVQITRVDAVLRCLDCGAEYPADEHPCPACGSAHAELAHGAELGVARAWGESLPS